MPPFRLDVQCIECSVKFSGYYPAVLRKADKHAGDKYHSLVAYRDGKEFCTIAAPLPESW